MNVNNLTLNDKLNFLSEIITSTIKQFPAEIKKTKYTLIDLDGKLFHADAIEIKSNDNDYISMLRELRKHKEIIVNHLLVDYLNYRSSGSNIFSVNLGLIKSVAGITIYYNHLVNSLFNGQLFKKELQKSAYYCVISDETSLWQNNNIDPLKEVEPVIDNYKIEPVSYDSWANYICDDNPLVILKKTNKELKKLKKVLPIELESIINQSKGHSKNKLIGLIKTTLLLQATKKESANYLYQLLTKTREKINYNTSQLDDCS